MTRNGEREDGPVVPEAEGKPLGPATRLVVGTLALPVVGLIAAGVLLVVGISLVIAGLVLLAALVAGAISVPLAVLANRRPRRLGGRRPSAQVLDVEADVRTLDRSEQNEEDATEEE